MCVVMYEFTGVRVELTVHTHVYAHERISVVT